MKLAGTTFILWMALICCLNNVNAQTGCDATRRINGIYYTSCFPREGTETDDTARIQRAVNSTIESGKLIFNEGLYLVSNTIELHSYLIIEGTAASSAETYSKSSIKMTASGKPIFKIGEGRVEISIRDIGLTATSTSGTIGILAEGHNPFTEGCPGGGTSAKFQFSNIRFSGLGKGIYVNTDCGYAGWMFDQVRLDNCTFDACQTGIEIRAQNSGWHMSNIYLGILADGYGIKIINGGYMSMNMVIGHGEKNSQRQPLANTFIYIRDHSVISIQNSTTEGFQTALDIDSGPLYSSHRTFPVTLINSGFLENVYLKNSTIVSTGNVYKPANVHLLENTHIYSVGDKFCWESANTPEECKNGDFVNEHPSTVKVFFRSNEKNTKIDTLKLGSTIFSNLGTPENGTLLYCSDCQQTNPCQGTGSGALAKRVAGAWVCN